MILAGHDTQRKVFLIAEAGVNHEGSFDEAMALVAAAKEAGADAVKFQTYRPETYIARSEKERFERVSRFALKLDDFRRLAGFAKKKQIAFFSTPLDPASVKALDPYVPFFKISSGDFDFEPLVRLIASRKKPVILSTGTGTLDQIRKSLRWIEDETSKAFVRDRVAVMHCRAAYPTPIEDANLGSIPFLRKNLGLVIGYSDHTQGIEAAPLAVAAGARIIEKHFTRSREGKVFRDHFISTTPEEFKEMAARIRRVELLYGTEEKSIPPVERQNEKAMKRGIALSRSLRKGNRLQASDFRFVRPWGDFFYDEASRLKGAILKNDVAEGMLLKREDIEPRRKR